MNEKRKEAGATREDIDQVLRALHDYKHYISESVESVSATQAKLEHRVATLETYAKILSGGVTITIAGIAALAFWFGGLRTTVSDAATKTDKVYAVVLENSDSLATRTTDISARTKAIETQLTDIKQQLNEISAQQRRR